MKGNVGRVLSLDLMFTHLCLKACYFQAALMTSPTQPIGGRWSVHGKRNGLVQHRSGCKDDGYVAEGTRITHIFNKKSTLQAI